MVVLETYMKYIDAKLDSKNQLNLLPELADLHNCNNTLYFEARRHEDLYLWAAKTPNGPSIKMHVQNVHTMDELKMTGNCLKGSRGLLSFDASFDETEWGRLTKEVFTHVRELSLLNLQCIPTFHDRSSVSHLKQGEQSHLLTIYLLSPFLTEKYGSAISKCVLACNDTTSALNELLYRYWRRIPHNPLVHPKPLWSRLGLVLFSRQSAYLRERLVVLQCSPIQVGSPLINLLYCL